jgi:hypothetical protein
MAGSTNNRQDAWLIKTDSDGNEEWNSIFGGPAMDEGYSVNQTKDGGYIIAGYTGSYGAGSADFWIIKTDAYGNEQWNVTFGGTGLEKCYSVQQTSDGGYIAAGYTNSFGAGYTDVWVVAYDEPKPDLTVEKSVEVGDGMFIVSYTVTNNGCGPAGESKTCKYVKRASTWMAWRWKASLAHRWVLERATAVLLIPKIARAVRHLWLKYAQTTMTM